jgi:cytochrome b6-f complex iron-sulfur subunit
MSEMNRREFVALSVAGTCACCAATQAEGPATKPAATGPTSRPAAGAIDAGAIESFKDDGVYDALRQSHKVIIYKQNNRLYASTARCSHKGCVLKAEGTTSLKCPCHGSSFDLNGAPSGGPAKVSLFRYAVSAKDGHLMVNVKKQFAEAKWEDKGAFIDLTKTT